MGNDGSILVVDDEATIRQLIAMLLGVMQSPIRNLVTVLSAPIRNLVMTVKAIADQKSEG